MSAAIASKTNHKIIKLIRKNTAIDFNVRLLYSCVYFPSIENVHIDRVYCFVFRRFISSNMFKSFCNNREISHKPLNCLQGKTPKNQMIQQINYDIDGFAMTAWCIYSLGCRKSSNEIN